MKTREYFETKTKELKEELKKEIKTLFNSKLNAGQYFVNTDRANCVNFDNNVTGMEDNGEIDYIKVYKHNIVVFPKGSDLDTVDLEHIEDIHDLMLLHFIGLNNLK